MVSITNHISLIHICGITNNIPFLAMESTDEMEWELSLFRPSDFVQFWDEKYRILDGPQGIQIKSFRVGFSGSIPSNSLTELGSRLDMVYESIFSQKLDSVPESAEVQASSCHPAFRKGFVITPRLPSPLLRFQHLAHLWTKELKPRSSLPSLSDITFHLYIFPQQK